MILTDDQTKAKNAIGKWLKVKKITPANWIFTLSGFAGSGKTTLLKTLIEEGVFGEHPICCAPTGKAASVLRGKLTGVDVKTVHQLLYNPISENMSKLDALVAERIDANTDGADVATIKRLDTLISQERDRLANTKTNFAVKANIDLLRGSTVIVDEASMVSEKMRDDFCAAGCRCLFVGDHFQLPPVNSVAWFTKADHNIQLTQVMRQALDSPIIRLSIQIREGYINQSEFTKGDCVLTSKDKLSYAEWLSADQVITGSNKSRHRINRFFRKQLVRDHSHLPVIGDRLICLKNDHYKIPAWINGVQFSATKDCTLSDNGENMLLWAEYEEAHLNGIEFYQHPCESHYNPSAVEIDREMRFGLFECDYAYAVTVHKSQGSEWPFVIVADDKMRSEDKDFRAKWLYTAITRAKNRMILVQ